MVAFSIAQQGLIDKLLVRRRQRDSSKNFFFRSDAAEPFFVKNLETVQGDERDTIIFSAGKIGYQVELAPADIKRVIPYDFESVVGE